MTNLTEIFEIATVYEDPSSILGDSKSFFCETTKRRNVFIEVVQSIDRIGQWFCGIHADGPFTLSKDSGEECLGVNYLFLCESIRNGSLREMYMDIKSIRSEMLTITTRENLEEFKQLNDFWENLEICFQVMMKNQSN